MRGKASLCVYELIEGSLNVATPIMPNERIYSSPNRVWLLFYVTNKALKIWEYYPLLVVPFPYLLGIIKGKST